MFFRACRHHSKSAKLWGHLIPFAPLSASGGNCPLCPPAPPPMQSVATSEVVKAPLSRIVNGAKQDELPLNIHMI